MEEYPVVHAFIKNGDKLMRSLTRTLSEKKIEAAIFIHARLYKLLPAAPKNVLTAIDTNDLISE
jgi:hypothetical protein